MQQHKNTAGSNFVTFIVKRVVRIRSLFCQAETIFIFLNMDENRERPRLIKSLANKKEKLYEISARRTGLFGA